MTTKLLVKKFESLKDLKDNRDQSRQENKTYTVVKYSVEAIKAKMIVGHRQFWIYHEDDAALARFVEKLTEDYKLTDNYSFYHLVRDESKIDKQTIDFVENHDFSSVKIVCCSNAPPIESVASIFPEIFIAHV